MCLELAPRKGRFSFGALLLGLGGVCFLLSWLAPNHYLPWLSFHNEAPMFASLLALMGATLCGATTVAIPRMVWMLPCALAALIAVQLANGVVWYYGHALLGCLYIVGIAMAWWMGGCAMRVQSDPRHVLAAAAAMFIVAAVLSGAIEVLQWLRMEAGLNMYAVEREPGSRPSGNLAQPNLLATLLVMGAVATGLLWRLGYLRNWQAKALLIYFSFTLVMTESRAGLLSAVCVGAVMLLRSRSVGWAGAWRAILLYWALLGLFWWSWAPLNDALLLQPARELQVGVDNVRWILWSQIFSAILQRPWWGYGWDQTAVAQKFGVMAAPGNWSTDYAHNLVLDILVWFGVPLGVLLLGGLALCLGRFLLRTRDSCQLLLFSMVVPLMVHSMLEFPFAYAFFLFPVACILGALHALQSPVTWEVRTRTSARVTRAVLSVLLAVYALTVGRVFVEYLEAEEDMRVMRFELRRVGQRPADHKPPRLLLLNQLDEVLTLGRVRPRREMATEELARMGRANTFHSWATLHLNYVIALGLNGQADEASRQLYILRGLYGLQSYAQAKVEFEAQRERWYPELAAVKLP